MAQEFGGGPACMPVERFSSPQQKQSIHFRKLQIISNLPKPGLDLYHRHHFLRAEQQSGERVASLFVFRAKCFLNTGTKLLSTSGEKCTTEITITNRVRALKAVVNDFVFIIVASLKIPLTLLPNLFAKWGLRK